MDDEASHNCKNVSAITSSEEEVRLVYKESIDVLNNKSPTTSNFYEMLNDVHSNTEDEVSMTFAAGPSGSSSVLADDTFQTSEIFPILPLYDNHAPQQFQGVIDNQYDRIGDIQTPTSYQADHNLPDLHVDRRGPPNYARSDLAESHQDCRKMIQHDADDQMEEFAGDVVLISYDAVPSGSSSVLADDTFQTSEAFPILPLYDNHTPQQFQGVNDNPHDRIGDIQTHTSHQADHNLPDLHVDRQVPPNCVRSDPADADHDLRKIIHRDADDHKKQFLHPGACEPSDNRERSFPTPKDVNGNEEYSRMQEMGRPMQVHTGKKQFNCSECTFKTSWRSSLKAHMQLHAGEKPVYKCEICGAEKSRKGCLKRHMQIHTTQKQFKCSKCGFETSWKFYLKTHIRTQHTDEEKSFKCHICTYETSWKGCLNDHMRTKHNIGEMPFKCHICTYGTTRKRELESHMKKHTGDEK